MTRPSVGSGYAILAENLCKRYGDAPALRGFGLRVPEGTVHGLLGPNGSRQDDRGTHPVHAGQAG